METAVEVAACGYPTEVIYRRFPKSEGGDVVAMFPAIRVDNCIHNCQSYQTIGQHGAASTDLIKWTSPAWLDESDVAQLHRELLNIGYNLKIVKRFTKKHEIARSKY